MWMVVGAHALTTVAAFSRKSVWDGFTEGDKSLADLDDADSFLGAAFLLVAVATLATAIVLAVWTHRTVSNGRARGAQASPGLGAGGWFIPIGWFFVSFGQLRKAMRNQGDTRSVSWWQGLWVVASVTGAVALQLFDDDLDQSPSEVSDGLRNQSVGLLISSVIFVAATIFAMRALRNVDEATSGVSPYPGAGVPLA